MMRPLELSELPPPPPGKTGWPWTEAGVPLAAAAGRDRRWPSISVVTPSFNQGQYLEETIRSVLLQQYPNLEYLVVDGGSTDESVSIIQKYEPWLSHWVSERDRGQSHAINKGLQRSTGEIFNWINSDDILTPDALQVVGVSFVDCDMVAGGNIVFGENFPERTRHARGLTAKALLRREAETEVHQMAMWVRRESALACGGLDEEMHHAFDPDFFIRYLHANPDVRYVDAILGRYRKHPDAKTVALRENFLPERLRTIEKISLDPRLADLRDDAAYAERRYRWWLRLAEIVNDPYGSSRRRALRILLSSVVDLDLRWDRVTQKAVRHLLRGRDIRPYWPVL